MRYAHSVHNRVRNVHQGTREPIHRTIHGKTITNARSVLGHLLEYSNVTEMNVTKGRNKKAEKPLECISSFHLIFLNKGNKTTKKEEHYALLDKEGNQRVKSGKASQNLVLYVTVFRKKHFIITLTWNNANKKGNERKLASGKMCEATKKHKHQQNLT